MTDSGLVFVFLCCGNWLGLARALRRKWRSHETKTGSSTHKQHQQPPHSTSYGYLTNVLIHCCMYNGSSPKLRQSCWSSPCDPANPACSSWQETEREWSLPVWPYVPLAPVSPFPPKSLLPSPRPILLLMTSSRCPCPTKQRSHWVRRRGCVMYNCVKPHCGTLAHTRKGEFRVN